MKTDLTPKVPLTIRVNESFFQAIDRARTATGVRQTRSDFVRNAVTSYLVYFERKVMPTLRRQHEELQEIDEPIDFFITSGTDEYDDLFW